MGHRFVMRAVAVALWHLAPIPVDRQGQPREPQRELVMAALAHVGSKA